MIEFILPYIYFTAASMFIQEIGIYWSIVGLMFVSFEIQQVEGPPGLEKNE